MTVFDFTILAALVVVAVLGFFVLLVMIGSRLGVGLFRHFRRCPPDLGVTTS